MDNSKLKNLVLPDEYVQDIKDEMQAILETIVEQPVDLHNPMMFITNFVKLQADYVALNFVLTRHQDAVHALNNIEDKEDE